MQACVPHLYAVRRIHLSGTGCILLSGAGFVDWTVHNGCRSGSLCGAAHADCLAAAMSGMLI